MERKIANVAVYVRKSRDEETEETLNRQQSVLTDMCIKNVWKYDLYREVGSSQTLDRPELQKMLTKIQSFHYDAVVVADLDRFSRDTGDFAYIKGIMLNAGCLAVTPGKIYDYSKQEDDLFSDLQSVLSKNEYQTIRKRLVRGTRQSAKDGNWMGKKVPVGYQYNRQTKRLEPSADAPVIKRLFDDYLSGLSTNDIAIKYTAEDVTTEKGIIWTPAGISRLLNNVAYKGHSLYGKTTDRNGKRAEKTKKEDQILVENTHEPIVDPEVYDKVQELKLQRNSRPVPLKFAKRKFSGLIKCAVCGAPHSFQASRGGRRRITSCQTRNYENDSLENYTVCKNMGTNIDEFEIVFFGFFNQYIGELEQYYELIKNSEKAESVGNEKAIAVMDKHIKRLNQEIKKTQQGFIAEIFTAEESASKIQSLRQQIENLEKEKEFLQIDSQTSGEEYLENALSQLKKFMSSYNSLSEREINTILKQYIDTIIYAKNEDTNNEIFLDIRIKDSVNPAVLG